MRRDCLGAMVLPMWGLCMVAGSAHAHGGPGPAQAATWFSGLVHPVLGADHLLAMLAVGLWSAAAPARRRWQAPALFVSTMLLGALAAGWGARGPAGGLEAAIAASVAALGVLLLGRAVFPRAWCMGLVAAAALLHGMAHGLEWDPATPWLAYGAGFTLTTALLHLGGLGLGLALQRMHAAWLRVAGMGIGGAGLAMLLARA